MTTAPYFLQSNNQYFIAPPKGSYHKADAAILYFIIEMYAGDFITSQTMQLGEGEIVQSARMDIRYFNAERLS